MNHGFNSNRITLEEMNFFTRGTSHSDDQENPTSIPNEIYHKLLALETVHANYSRMKDSLVDAGRLLC